MNILFITPYIPFPLDSGGNQAFYSMIDGIRKLHNVHLLFPVFRKDIRNFSGLKEKWDDVTFHPFIPQEGINIMDRTALEGPEYNTLHFKLITYMNASSKRKIARYRRKHPVIYTDPERLVRKHSMLYDKNPFLTESFISHVQATAALGFDCIQVEFYDFLPLYYVLPDNCTRIFVHHELRHVRIENELGLLKDASFEEKLLAERIKMEELGMLNMYDRIIVLTETDKKLLCRYIPEEKIRVSPAIINPSGINASRKFEECGPEFVFIGGNGHFPNYDGINWFCTEILPLLRDRLNEFRVHIIGKWDEKIASLYSSKFPELIFEGYVKDTGSILSGKISIVPIRIGSGMRMKILEAIENFSPFITTVKGVEGQDFTNGSECIIADNAEDFADAMAGLCSNKGLQKALAANALKKLRESYDPEIMKAIRMRIYEEIEKQPGRKF